MTIVNGGRKILGRIKMSYEYENVRRVRYGAEV